MVTSIPVPDVENLNIGWSQLGNDRRSRVKVAMATLIENIDREGLFTMAKKVCRFKGLILSIDRPTAYIKNAKLDNAGFCVLTSINNSSCTLSPFWEPRLATILFSC
ncbi:uncharacterized protein LOC126841658 [Adelges cooleyi]|uniref:uncharacterized protein LOC126841658 n=1 Tax=Adelges cooleyi TaxID=133065 RepID=UPI00217FCBC6|nr:uncharacterized protein LOC126841658 [Adelges cooleyi]